MCLEIKSEVLWLNNSVVLHIYLYVYIYIHIALLYINMCHLCMLSANQCRTALAIVLPPTFKINSAAMGHGPLICNQLHDDCNTNWWVDVYVYNSQSPVCTLGTAGQEGSLGKTSALCENIGHTYNAKLGLTFCSWPVAPIVLPRP